MKHKKLKKVKAVTCKDNRGRYCYFFERNVKYVTDMKPCRKIDLLTGKTIIDICNEGFIFIEDIQEKEND